MTKIKFTGQKVIKSAFCLCRSPLSDRFFMLRKGDVKFLANFKGNNLPKWFEVLRRLTKSPFSSKEHFRRCLVFYEGLEPDIVTSMCQNGISYFSKLVFRSACDVNEAF